MDRRPVLTRVVTLTERDREVLRTLTHKVRVLTPAQAARGWWGETSHAEENARDRLGSLRRAGFVDCRTVMTHPELPVAAPVFRWRPGEDPPNLGAVAYRLRARWTSHPVAISLVYATRKSLNLFGGYIADRPPRRTEVAHDIHLSAVYLWHRANAPGDADRWESEHELHAAGGGRNERLPDARIRDDRQGRGGGRIVEFGGAYPKAKLEEFHAEFSGGQYEIW